MFTFPLFHSFPIHLRILRVVGEVGCSFRTFLRVGVENEELKDHKEHNVVLISFISSMGDQMAPY